jgi:hypothetical protein
MPPNIEQRLKSLESKHKALDKQIEQLYKHTSAELSIKKLKKEKLLLKQEIVKLTNQLGEHNG